MNRFVLVAGMVAVGLQAAFGADAPEACRKLWNDEVEGIRRRAAQRVEEIQRTGNPVVPAGARTYWISDRGGNDAADGSSPELLVQPDLRRRRDASVQHPREGGCAAFRPAARALRRQRLLPIENVVLENVTVRDSLGLENVAENVKGFAKRNV